MWDALSTQVSHDGVIALHWTGVGAGPSGRIERFTCIVAALQWVRMRGSELAAWRFVEPL